MVSEKECWNSGNMINDNEKLYKGVFWITDQEDLDNNELVFRIPVDPFGNTDPSVDRSTLNSKNHENYNHRKLWESLGSKITHNKEFDYYPRGRVEISNGKAVIYASPYICTEEIIAWIKSMFNITEHNGIKKIRVVPDNSAHYISRQMEDF